MCAGHNLLKLSCSWTRLSGKVRDKGAAGNSREWHGIAACGIFQLPSAYTYPCRSETVVPAKSRGLRHSQDGLLGPSEADLSQTGNHHARRR